MELKPTLYACSGQYAELLIVPYGIETRKVGYRIITGTALLIVPYGIETRFPS